MYAFVRLGSQEFKVKAGDFLRVSSLKKDHAEKSLISLNPFAFEEKDKFYVDSSDLEKALVKANILRHGLRKKVLVFKKKRRKGYRRTKGHRQAFTELQICEIKSPSGKIEDIKKVAKKVMTSKKKKSSEPLKKEISKKVDKKV